MRFAVIVLVVAATIALCQAQDIGGMLMNRQLVNREIRCILDQGPCDAIGRQIKGLLPEVMNNNCARCTARQARNARRLIDFMQSQHPYEWQEIVQRYTYY